MDYMSIRDTLQILDLDITAKTHRIPRPTLILMIRVTLTESRPTCGDWMMTRRIRQLGAYRVIFMEHPEAQRL